MVLSKYFACSSGPTCQLLVWYWVGTTCWSEQYQMGFEELDWKAIIRGARVCALDIIVASEHVAS